MSTSTALIIAGHHDEAITIRRADLAAAAARVAEFTCQPHEGVEQALWIWAEACAALLVQEAAMEVLRPDGRAVTEHATDPDAPPF